MRCTYEYLNVDLTNCMERPTTLEKEPHPIVGQNAYERTGVDGMGKEGREREENSRRSTSGR